MPELEANGRGEFLQRIADGLPFDEAEKLDIVRELAGHLTDSTTQLEADGLTLDEAERTALELTRPAQVTRRADPERIHLARRMACRNSERLVAPFGGVVFDSRHERRKIRRIECASRSRWSMRPLSVKCSGGGFKIDPFYTFIFEQQRSDAARSLDRDPAHRHLLIA